MVNIPVNSRVQLKKIAHFHFQHNNINPSLGQRCVARRWRTGTGDRDRNAPGVTAVSDVQFNSRGPSLSGLLYYCILGVSNF